MAGSTVGLVALYLVLLILLTVSVGAFMAKLFAGERTFLSLVLGPLEDGLYRAAGIDPAEEQHWTTYALALLAFNLLGMLLVYGLLRVQDLLLANPAGLAAVAPDLAFNTAASFVTNTNWQAYGGESTLSYLSQMTALTVQNFLSAATGAAVAVALIRGFARRGQANTPRTIGNFWADMVRATLYLLLPACVLLALFHVWQGVPQNLDTYVAATTLEGASQTIAQGPVASQMAIKHLGTNGGGFFNANAAHPFENPTPLNNFVVMLAIFAIPSALTYTFGLMVGDRRQGLAIWAAMTVMFLAGVALATWQEAGGNPFLAGLGVDQAAGTLEGKEVRFGIPSSTLFAVITTAASCGAVNAMHDSFTALGGMVPLVNILLGEVIFGGVGAGLYGMLVFVILAVFIAGLMVGRTPEYLGKKIEAREVKLAVLTILVFPAFILTLAALSLVLPDGLAGIQDPGPHGLTEVLYAFASATGNNGSAFAGLSANTPYYNSLIGAAVLAGRFLVIIPTLAIAGSLVAKKTVPVGPGTFPTTGPLFVSLLVGVIVIVGGLTFFPALALGPIAEHLAIQAGHSFGG